MLLNSAFSHAGQQTYQQGIYAPFLAAPTAVKSRSPRSGGAGGGGLDGGGRGKNNAMAERIGLI